MKRVNVIVVECITKSSVIYIVIYLPYRGEIKSNKELVPVEKNYLRGAPVGSAPIEPLIYVFILL